MEESENEEKLRFENELKKMKLSAENGAKFMEGSELPPEVESQWLDQIMAFEKASQDRNTIKIYDYLDRPQLIPLHEVPDHQVKEELDKLHQLMASKRLSLDTICEVDDKELYRFIVEELMDTEIEDVLMEGMVMHLTYEEFHPNHPYDIKRYTEDFINTLMRRNTQYCHMGLADEVISYNGDRLKEDESKKILINFIDSFQQLQLKTLVLEEPEINEDIATQKINIEYKGDLQDSHESVTHAGEGQINFIHDYGHWYINGVDMPGLRI